MLIIIGRKARLRTLDRQVPAPQNSDRHRSSLELLGRAIGRTISWLAWAIFTFGGLLTLVQYLAIGAAWAGVAVIRVTRMISRTAGLAA